MKEHLVNFENTLPLEVLFHFQSRGQKYFPGSKIRNSIEVNIFHYKM